MQVDGLLYIPHQIKAFPKPRMLLLTLYVIGGKRSVVENPRMPLPGACSMGGGGIFYSR